jgi:hypothetical protein
MNRRMLPVLLLVAVSFFAPGRSSRATPPPEQGRTRLAVQVDMRNVLYHCTDRIVVHIRQLHGKVPPTQRARVPVFDDVQSFTLALEFAEIAIGMEALSHLLNHDVFAALDAPLKEVAVTSAGPSLKVHGKWHAKGDLPFDTEGMAAATPEGYIRIHTHKISLARLPVKSLLDLLGLTSAQVLKMDHVRGVRLEGHDLLLDPTLLLPPPRMTGRVTDVQVHGDHLLLVFGTKALAGVRSPHSGNYMAYRGGQLRFGKITMSDTDLMLLDLDPQDPFDFSLAHYKDRVAGYTKTTPDFGLRVFMRDFNKVPPQPSSRGLAIARPPAVPSR